MRFTVLILYIVFASVCFGQSDSIENGWKGIKVMQTSRAEVEKSLGKPTVNEYGTIKYDIEDGFIEVAYSIEPCSNLDSVSGRYDIPKAIVLEYEVVFNNDLRITYLKRKEELYTKTEDPELIYNYHYSNQKDGITVTTKAAIDTEYVRSIQFFVTIEMYEKHLCKNALTCKPTM